MSIQYLFKICLLTSVKGSILILLVLFIQRYFKRNFTSKWIYILSVVAVVRLLLPRSPLVNVLSLYNLLLYKRFSFNIKDIILGKSAVVGNSFNFIDSKYNVANFISESLSFNCFKFCSTIWIIGVFAFAIGFIALNFIFFKRLKQQSINKNPQIIELLHESKQLLKYSKHVSVYSTTRLSSPITYGVFKPKIILPKYILTNFSENKLKHIILHELVHIKHHDNLFNFICTIACVFHWYNPLVWYIYFRLKKDCELACDEKVLLLLNDTEYLQYGRTLIEVMQCSINNNYHKTIINQAFVNDRSEANERISQISRFKPKHKSILILSTCFLILFILVSFNEDKSTRPLSLTNNLNITSCLNMTKQELKTLVKAQPIHSFFLISDEKPYYILYYNIKGVHYQFWYNAITYNDSLKPIEITTTKYLNISRGTKTSNALVRAKENFGEPIQLSINNDYNQYIYQHNSTKVMLIADNKTNKIYSITLY
ncbi:M56 family metallopeptidase [Clostridium sp. 'deep sea']|uniref:M56 family metallopeptidase n=1 Tax=Clostridium sp. 'deep sea' TaxID=2779445 RepID=UPI001896A481|nr:M56 family metallopeptidase [Clostridium sp. 'deep sea']QOR35267.1 M56 family metallopeptidase [Clostridium sp. 'deep sea']